MRYSKQGKCIAHETSIDGVNVKLKLAIKKSPQKNKFWMHSVYNIENVTVEHGLPGIKSDMPESSNDDTYTISQLYRTVKKIPRKDGGLKYTPAEKAKYEFAYTKRNDGIKYQYKDSDGNELSENQQEFFKNSRGDTKKHPYGCFFVLV